MRLSPLLREKLGIDPPKLLVKCIIEVRRDKLDYVLSELQAMGIRVDRRLISQPVPGGNYYIPAWIPTDKIEEVSRIEGVVNVSKAMPRAIGSCTLQNVPFFARIKDELLGEVRIPDVEVPMQAILEAVPNPISVIKALGALAVPLTGFNPITNIRIFPTSVTAKILKDVRTKDGAGVTVAILDTGSPALTPQFMPKNPMLREFTLWPEPPQDGHGHGSWCHNCVCGLEAPSPYGMMTGMAPAVEKSIHVKVLNTFPGCGSTEQVLKGIEIAVKEGAKVVSMSLGGPAQGNGVDDPEAKVVNELAKEGVLFAIAMGNSGPNLFTGGSPGCALKAITVGSVSIIDKFKPAWWSSRGPGSDWDGEHEDDYKKVLGRYRDEIIKPDCTATGGGRASKGAKPDEVIWSGATGWFEGFYDGIKDATCGMHGTSQATPHVAGLLACLLSDEIIDDADDVKKQLKDTADEYIVLDPYNEEVDREFVEAYGKSIATGWGLFKLSRFKR